MCKQPCKVTMSNTVVTQMIRILYEYSLLSQITQHRYTFFNDYHLVKAHAAFDVATTGTMCISRHRF